MKHEARRQQALLAAVAGAGPACRAALRPRGASIERGLAAYVANARALAERALEAACPTLHEMLGAPAFARLAQDFWRAHPPQRGDIAEWGDALPAWIEAEPALAEWPWLADCTRLDLARQRCERAADAIVDNASLARLGERDPAELALLLMPGSALIESRFPIGSIHAAHQASDAAGDRFGAVRAALAAGRGETVFVARRGWRAELHLLSPAERTFVAALLAGHSLGAALQAAAPGFDFGAWLQRALRAGWLCAVARHAG
jgi:hypothetical protein